MAGILLKALFVALLVSGFAAGTTVEPAEAQTSQKQAKPLTGKSYYGRRGGYTVKKADVIGDTRRQDPSLNARTSGSPLMGDFFFEQPTSPIGGNTSYMH